MPFNNAKGLSLLELAIVMSIFTIVSIGVVNLTVKSIENANNESAVATENHILNVINEDIKEDLKTAIMVHIGDGTTSISCDAGTGLQCTTLTNCATASLTQPKGNTLDILQATYTAGSPGTTAFRLVRYQFRTRTDRDNPRDATDPRILVRMVQDEGSLSGSPGTFGIKKNLASAGNYTCNMPTITIPTFNIANIGSSLRIYNNSDALGEFHDIYGSGTNSNEAFTGYYGDKYTPTSGSSWTSCSFMLNQVRLRGLMIESKEPENSYDQEYGLPIRLSSPDLNYDLRTSTKYF